MRALRPDVYVSGHSGLEARLTAIDQTAAALPRQPQNASGQPSPSGRQPRPVNRLLPEPTRAGFGGTCRLYSKPEMPDERCRKVPGWCRHGRSPPSAASTWVEPNFSHAVARAYAGHTDSGGEAGATHTYVRATVQEVAAALAALTGPDGASALQALARRPRRSVCRHG